jgi:hypothetical protein
MSESQWGDEGQNAPAKKKVPTWVWACGGGCLVALILGIIAVVVAVRFGTKMVQEGRDPEVQWPKLAHVLPYDARPPELTLEFGFSIGMDMFVLKDSRGFIAVIYRVPEKSADEVRHQMLDENFKGGPFGIGGGNRTELKAVTIKVQGRDLKGVRFHQQSQMGSKPKGGEDAPDVGSGPAVMLEVTPDGDTRPVILQLVRTGGSDPISDEEVQTFLKPFHVGSER